MAPPFDHAAIRISPRSALRMRFHIILKFAFLPGIFDPHSHFPLSANTVLFQVDLSSPPVGKY
jgi:hypothetical protein